MVMKGESGDGGKRENCFLSEEEMSGNVEQETFVCRGMANVGKQNSKLHIPRSREEGGRGEVGGGGGKRSETKEGKKESVCRRKKRQKTKEEKRSRKNRTKAQRSRRGEAASPSPQRPARRPPAKREGRARSTIVILSATFASSANIILPPVS